MQHNALSKKARISIWAGLLLVSFALATAVYLFHDTPFPTVDKDKLVLTHSVDIQAGQSVDFVGDSLTRNIHSEGIWFKDAAGRTMILNGINVGGNVKVPFKPSLPTHVKENFLECAYTVSFTGRPFPIEEADEHFSRLNRWGYRFLRLLVSWEAVEHAGPGIYDEEYLEYLRALVIKSAQYHINVFIDPHQDAWSRFTGGDGAPYWTLEVVGFNPIHMHETGAAVLHQWEGDPLPSMLWSTNYFKLGTSTMFALFFGSEDFAPDLKVGGVSAQEYLQSHYINAIKQVALKLKGLPNVIGFDVMNEPTSGLIGASDLLAEGIYKNGAMPTPFQGMVAGAGIPVEVPYYEFDVPTAKEIGKVKLNPMGVSVWKSPEADVWRKAGVWGLDAAGKPALKKPRYFTTAKGRDVEFSLDYYRPFVVRFAKEMNSIDSTWLIFVERPSLLKLPRFTPAEARTLVHASHSYDVVTLLTKKYNSWMNVDVRDLKVVFGKTGIREMFHSQMQDLRKETEETMGLRPTLLGEFGVPMDLGDRNAFKDGDYADQEDALDRSIRPLESNLMSYTLWVYSSDNDHERGDQWNGEDLSIYSKSEQQAAVSSYSGGRALAAAIRPYPYKIAGQPLRYFFDKDHHRFYLKYKADPLIQAPTEIFVPEFHYAKGFKIYSSPGKFAWDEEQRILIFRPEKFGIQELIIE
ncbi:MAG: cellulase family glycosylhydrolase [Bacteroidetes bacterium]|nr:cellulase family glycosylhydrolase [Bacteroidota bacterium]